MNDKRQNLARDLELKKQCMNNEFDLIEKRLKEVKLRENEKLDCIYAEEFRESQGKGEPSDEINSNQVKNDDNETELKDITLSVTIPELIKFCPSYFNNIMDAINKDNLITEIKQRQEVDTSYAKFTVASSISFDSCFENNENHVVITVMDENGNIIQSEDLLLTATISTTNGETFDISSIKYEDKIYTISFVLTLAGEYYLEIKLNDESIRGSPFLLNCLPESAIESTFYSNYTREKSDYSGLSHQSSFSEKQKDSTIKLSRYKRKSDEGPRQKPSTYHRSYSDNTSKQSTYCLLHGYQGLIYQLSEGSMSNSVNISQAKKNQSTQPNHRKSNNQLLQDDWINTIGGKGYNKGSFINPQGVTVTSGGRILVTDSSNHNVQSFNYFGGCTGKFGIKGYACSPGYFQRPTGIAVTRNGNILISDFENKCVNIYGPSGKYINRMGIGKLLGPKGVCFCSKNNRIIVVDNKSGTIFVFKSNGKLLFTFGSQGCGIDQFSGPHFVTTNQLGDILITDFHNHCVKIYNSEGIFKLKFGAFGEEEGNFNGPTGIGCDTQNNILVADWGNSRISVFDKWGNFRHFIKTHGHNLYGPQGLCISNILGHVIVADSGNHCIKIFKYSS